MSSFSVRGKHNGEIKQFDNIKERQRVDDLADFYSIIKRTEALEAAYSRDAISRDEYSAACHLLISQFKTAEAPLLTTKAIASADSFFKEFHVDCPRAYERLISSGVPATVIHASSDNNRTEGIVVAETVQAFITTMDALKLGQRAVDEVQPLVSDTASSLVKVSNLPADFEGLEKLRLWLKKLNTMRAHEEIEEDEARQLLFDIEASYGAFCNHLQGKK
jgi:ESCRT-I complex subunit VPS28